MVNLLTAEDVKNNARAKVEKYFNEHVEYNSLLREINYMIKKISLELIYSDDGINIAFDDEFVDEFYLESYVALPINEEEVVRLGTYVVALFKLSGYNCTCKYREKGRLESICINVCDTPNDVDAIDFFSCKEYIRT